MLTCPTYDDNGLETWNGFVYGNEGQSVGGFPNLFCLTSDDKKTQGVYWCDYPGQNTTDMRQDCRVTGDFCNQYFYEDHCRKTLRPNHNAVCDTAEVVDLAPICPYGRGGKVCGYDGNVYRCDSPYETGVLVDNCTWGCEFLLNPVPEIGNTGTIPDELWNWQYPWLWDNNRASQRAAPAMATCPEFGLGAFPNLYCLGSGDTSGIYWCSGPGVNTTDLRQDCTLDNSKCIKNVQSDHCDLRLRPDHFAQCVDEPANADLVGLIGRRELRSKEAMLGLSEEERRQLSEVEEKLRGGGQMQLLSRW